jgi:hypothetical protein
MAKNAAGRSQRLEICLAAELELWVADPIPKSKLSAKLKARILHVFGRIESYGRSAGTDFLEQVDLPLNPPLLEVKVEWNGHTYRLFGVSVGNQLCLSERVLKKRQSLTTDEYKSLHKRAKAYADGGCLEETNGGKE